MKTIIILLLSVLILQGCSKSKKGASGRGSGSTDASGLALFQENGQFGYKDISGQIAIKAQYAEAGEFSEGLARVKAEGDGAWGYINPSGDQIIPPQFQGASDFIDGRAVVLSSDKFLYISPEGLPLGYYEESPSYHALSAGDTLFVIHPNGLIARAAGDLNSEAVGEVQFGEPVEYVYDPNARQYESIEGLRGAWFAVRFGEKRGYLFDVYLSRFPQAEEKRVVESYKVVVSQANNQNYSTYTLAKYLSSGRLTVHEGLDWAESQEIVPASSLEQVIARMKLFPSGDVGSVVGPFVGESAEYTTQNGEPVTATVRRDASGFLENVTFTRKTEDQTLDIGINRYNIHDVEIVISSTSTEEQSQGQESD